MSQRTKNTSWEFYFSKIYTYILFARPQEFALLILFLINYRNYTVYTHVADLWMVNRDHVRTCSTSNVSLVFPMCWKSHHGTHNSRYRLYMHLPTLTTPGINSVIVMPRSDYSLLLLNDRLHPPHGFRDIRK
jgi:hypothetical protein